MEFSLTFTSQNKQPGEPTKITVTEARSFGFDQKILSTPDSKKSPYAATSLKLKPIHCKTWLIFDKADGSEDSKPRTLEDIFDGRLEENVEVNVQADIGVKFECDVKLENQDNFVADNGVNVEDNVDPLSLVWESPKRSDMVQEEKSLAEDQIHIPVLPAVSIRCSSSTSDKGSVSTSDGVHNAQCAYAQTCAFCNKGFDSVRDLDMHVITHSKTKHFKCDVCDKRFSTSSNRDAHARTHTGQKPYACDICNKSFTSSSSRKKHMIGHTGEKAFKCNICDKSFSRATGRKSHARVHSRGESFSCYVCDKTFAFSCNRDIHVKTHGVKPFACEFCNKSFTSPSIRNKHMRLHTEGKAFTCEVCQKGFVSSGHRDEHLRTHTGEKPFACEVCNKSFASSSNRNKHMRLHTGEKPFPCTICDRSFAFSGHRDIHVRNHTGDKPFTCEFCDKSFNSPSSRNKHTRLHTGEKYTKCDAQISELTLEESTSSLPMKVRAVKDEPFGS